MTNINFKNLFFEFKGRIDRQMFWVGIGGIFVASAITQAAIFASVNASDAELVAMLSGLLFIFPLLAVSAKRNRDRGQSMYWLLIIAAPIAGFIWMVVDLGMRPARDETQIQTAKATA